MGGFLKSIATATFVVLFAIIFQAYKESGNLQDLTEVLSSLVKLEKVTRTEIPKIVIGYGGCSDLRVRAVDFLDSSKIVGDSPAEIKKEEINTFEDFMRSFSFYFKASAAAERYTSNKALFRELVEKASKHPSALKELGGNACLMGTRFLMERMEVLLAATMSEEQKEMLINGFDVVDFKPPRDFLEDVHLILEYKTGDKFGNFTATRANRYILHSDTHNPLISSLELLDVNSYSPNLFVVSGLQMLDNFPFPKPSIRSERIKKVMQQIHSVKKSTLIHFEMASYVQMELMEDLRLHILPYVDSIGCNEQEIDNLVNFLENGKISYSSDSNPRVASTLDQARKVFKLLNANYFLNRDQNENLRLLSRIHIHTLAFQLIFNAKESKWKNIRGSVAKSVLTAHRHVCQTNYVNPEASMLILDDSFATSMSGESKYERPKRIEIKKKSPISCWSEKMSIGGHLMEVKICIGPNMVCKDAKKTAGAGDMISASGLAAQI